MQPAKNSSGQSIPIDDDQRSNAELLRDYFLAQRHLRKGICLLNAGQFDLATDEFMKSSTMNSNTESLTEYLTTAMTKSQRYSEAQSEIEKHLDENPDDIDDIVRLSLIQWKRGDCDNAVATLRNACRKHGEAAELHFQLGTLLAAREQLEEAELRFTQAIAIDHTHPEALVSLALCRGAQQDTVGAVKHLIQAQRQQPASARIALLLSCAAKACQDAGIEMNLRAVMPEQESGYADDAVEQLGRILEIDPEFAEALLALDDSEVEKPAFDLLAITLKHAIDRNPRHANLYYLRSKVLARIGQANEAIASAEQALTIEPRMVKALILLSNLYRQTDRLAEATSRLENAMELGAKYADIYYLLGNLYRDAGNLQQARSAYEKALSINNQYEDARNALDSLAA